MNLGESKFSDRTGVKLQRIWKTVEGSNISEFEREEISMLLKEIYYRNSNSIKENEKLIADNRLQSTRITELENEVSSLKDETNDDADEWDPFSEDENEFEEEFDLSDDDDFSLSDDKTATNDTVMKALEALDEVPAHSMKIDPVAFDREMKKHPRRGRNKKS